MKPETIAKLKENIPELRELITFLAAEAQKLNTLDGIDDLPRSTSDIAVEALARMRAYQTITAMLAPLVNSVEKGIGADPSEYVV